MRTWKLTALSMAVLIATALMLRMLAGTAARSDRAPLLASQPPVSHPAAVVAYVMEHPSVARRLMPLLDRNLPMADAAQGFADPVMFAAVVHAADNLNVPFTLLKKRVLAGGTSLLDAIRAVKPNVDAGSEAMRAYGQARYTVGR
jgi:hypothetical protein